MPIFNRFVRGYSVVNMHSQCKSILIIGLVLTLISCAGVKTNPRPAWVNDPGDKHVGKCGTHIRGLIYQEQCAYKKGLAYIAMTKGVTAEVIADMNISQSTYGAGSSNGSLNANIRMQGKEIRIKGKIIEKWHDRVNDVFYVLIKEE